MMMKKTIRFVLVMCAVGVARQAAADVVPQFNYLAPGWLPLQTISLTPFWSAAGLPETGTNYYSLGAPLPGSPYWERFDPNSPYYQAWFGAYVVGNFQFASEWEKPNLQPSDISQSVARVEALSVVDQDAWLEGYGNTAPNTQVVPNSTVVVPAGNGFFRVFYTLTSESDVGGTIPQYPFYPPYSTASNLVPPYQPVVIEATLLLKYLPVEKELIVIYASNTTWKLKDGSFHTTSLPVIAQQFEMSAAVSVPQQ
jgi:hypothetical protein